MEEVVATCVCISLAETQSCGLPALVMEKVV